MTAQCICKEQSGGMGSRYDAEHGTDSKYTIHHSRYLPDNLFPVSSQSSYRFSR